MPIFFKSKKSRRLVSEILFPIVSLCAVQSSNVKVNADLISMSYDNFIKKYGDECDEKIKKYFEQSYNDAVKRRPEDWKSFENYCDVFLNSSVFVKVCTKDNKSLWISSWELEKNSTCLPKEDKAALVKHQENIDTKTPYLLFDSVGPRILYEDKLYSCQSQLDGTFEYFLVETDESSNIKDIKINEGVKGLAPQDMGYNCGLRYGFKDFTPVDKNKLCLTNPNDLDFGNHLDFENHKQNNVSRKLKFILGAVVCASVLATIILVSMTNQSEKK